MAFLAALPALATAAASAYSAYQSSRSSPNQVQNFDIYSKDQKKLIDMMSQQAFQPNQNAFGYLNGLLSGDDSAYEDYEAPYLRQFQEDIIPSIMERFGSQGALSSSGLNQTLARAGQGLSENLAAQRANLKGNAVQMLGNLNGQALTQRTGRYLERGAPGNPQATAEGLYGAAKGLGQGAQDFFNYRSPQAMQAPGPGGGHSMGGNVLGSLYR